VSAGVGWVEEDSRSATMRGGAFIIIFDERRDLSRAVPQPEGGKKAENFEREGRRGGEAEGIVRNSFLSAPR